MDPLELPPGSMSLATHIAFAVNAMHDVRVHGTSLHWDALEDAEIGLKRAIAFVSEIDRERVEPILEYQRRVAEMLLKKLERARCPGCGSFHPADPQCLCVKQEA